MSASTITRTTWTDDDGTGTTGTILQNSELQKIYDAIDQLHSGTGSYATLELGGGAKVDGVLDLAGYKETLTDVAIAANTLTLNLALGSAFRVTVNANINTTTFANIPASGRYASFALTTIGNGSAFTWTWFASTVLWPGGLVPTRTSTNAKRDFFLFITLDGGTTWFGFAMGQNL